MGGAKLELSLSVVVQCSKDSLNVVMDDRKNLGFCLLENANFVLLGSAHQITKVTFQYKLFNTR